MGGKRLVEWSGRIYDISIISSGVGEGRGTARGEIGDGVELVRNSPIGKGFRVCIREIGEATTQTRNRVNLNRSRHRGKCTTYTRCWWHTNGVFRCRDAHDHSLLRLFQL